MLPRPFYFLAVGAALTAGCRPPQAPPPALPPPAVTVAKPGSARVQSYYEYNGYLEPVETVQIRARVQGILKGVKFTDGGEVKQGELLYEIDPREYAATVKKADADRLKALAELKKSKTEEERGRTMLATRAISEEDFQQRQTARETADAVVKQTEAAIESAKIQLSYTEVRAPISGTVSRTLITQGNLVGQGEATLLTNIVRTDEVYVYFDVPERDLVTYQKTRPSRTATPDARVEIGVATEEGYPHAGLLDFRENRVDTGTGTVRLRGLLKNPQKLLYPGLYARVRLPVGVPRDLLALPEDALLTGQEGRFVYVIGPENKALKRTVTVGPSVWKVAADANSPAGWMLFNNVPPGEDVGGAGSRPIPVRSVVAIESGLQADDRVIVNGLQRTRPGSPVAPEEWELRAAPRPQGTP